ncbi:Response regulator receiver domain-containing protein [Methylobacterium sp. 174MFSha1.1]|uniref:response regulator n=1 Tax=Methylobacterium sp. 174MFSha1.1 TaxID=1502749 RepID=UPI0008EF143D|nr:response regulator [Methylobacterium sp. 174MFSha1.1]SFU71508.1 Response regulator receiver domain-containing protein [Methylobacterium sp. 174MFSha1.1]
MTGQEKPDRLRVLVVEDEYFIADDISRALIRHGAEVVGPVPTVQQARALLDSQALDLAVLDINLRGELVYPLVAELSRRGVPMVFATGYDAAAIPADYEAIPSWSKPFDYNALAGVLPALRRT